MTGENVEETKEFLQASLASLDAELERISPDLKSAWLMAQKHCEDPSLIDDRHKLLFLRCEDFDPEVAALRLVRYWAKRLELFGTDKAFLPLTLGAACCDDAVAIGFGQLQFLGFHPETGEGIVWEDMTRFPPEFMGRQHKYVRRLSLTRALWYAMHAVLEEEQQVQRCGLLFLAQSRCFTLRKYDPVQTKMFLDSMRYCLPVRIREMHMINPTTFLRLFFLPCHVKSMFSDMCLYLHPGRKATLTLEKEHGIPPSLLPTDIPGGTLHLDYDTWLEKRKRLGL